MDEAAQDGDSVSNFSHISSSSSSTEDPFVLIRVYVPDLKVQKCLQFHRDDLVWEIKQQVLAALPKELRDCQNYGLFSPPANSKAGKFLDEERPIADYPFNGRIGYFELKYKKRVYKMKIDEKQIKQLHTRSNLRRMIEYVSGANQEKVSKMLNKGMDPNFHCAESGETLLSLTAGLKHPSKVIMLLVNGGAILDYRNRDGKTALHRSVERNNYEALKTILDLGASPNYKDNKGLTPLYYTVTHNADPQLCELLLHDHATIGTADLQGWQEVHQAARNGMVQHLEHLLFYGADMNARNASGNTPLHVCTVNDQESCTRLLLFRGCDKDAMNYANQTPYQMAVIANNLHLADLIQRHGPDHIVPFREAPRYNPKRRASLAASVVNASLNRTHSDPRLELVLQSGIVHKPPSPSPSNRSLPPFSSASSSGETTCTESSSAASTVTTCTSSHCEDSEDTTSSSIMTDSSGVGTSMNSGGSYESSPYPEAIVMSGMTVVCVENHIDYNSPGHLKVYQGDILEVTGVTDCGLVEAISRKGEHGFVPTSCVQEVKLRNPDFRSSNKSRTEGRRELENRKLSSIPRGIKTYGEPRTVILHKGKKGFGFVLRGAKAASPLMEAPPCEDLPSLQYLEDVDKGGVADLAGLRKGDYLLEINGLDVALVSHENVVSTIRNSGDLVAMTVVSPLAPLNGTNIDSQSATRQCATLPRKLSGKRAPVPPKRDPTTTLSVGRERAKSLVAGLAEMEALDRVMADYDSEGRSTKSSSVESLPNKQNTKAPGDQQPKIASIRKRPGAHRANINKLEEMFNRQELEHIQSDGGNNSYPSTPMKVPKVYASVAEMKRQKSKNKGDSTLLKLHNSFHSTPDLHRQQKNTKKSNRSGMPQRNRSHSQSDINALNAKNTYKSLREYSKYASKDKNNLIIPKPPPDEPPPPPPVGQIVKVDVSKVHGDYASVTVSGGKKDEVMSSFRPGDSAKFYASPETLNNVGIKNEKLAGNEEGTLNRSRKYSTTSNGSSRSTSLPPKINAAARLQQKSGAANNASSESENSGESSNAIHSTFKNGSTTSNQSSNYGGSTEYGNSSIKGNFTKDKPLYAKPMMQKTRPFIPDPDYDLSESEERESVINVNNQQKVAEVMLVQERVRKLSEGSTQESGAKEELRQQAKNGPNVVFISNKEPKSEKASLERKNSEKPIEFKDDLAKKIAERNSKIVVVDPSEKKNRKVEIVDVKPGTMKDIMDRRKECSTANENSTVKRNISVFERKYEVPSSTNSTATNKMWANEHRRSDGIRLAAKGETDSSLIKSSQSYPSELSQEDPIRIASEPESAPVHVISPLEARSMASETNRTLPRNFSKNSIDADYFLDNKNISRTLPRNTSLSHNSENASVIRSTKPSQKIKMGTGQALLMKESTMDLPPTNRKTISLGQSGMSHSMNRNTHHQQIEVVLSKGVRPKSVQKANPHPLKNTDDWCSDIEKSIEESLEMIKMQVDLLGHGGKTSGNQKPELVPPPPEFDSSRTAMGNVEQMAPMLAPPPEFSDSFKMRKDVPLAHSLPKTKYSKDVVDHMGTRSHSSSPARQMCNGNIPPTSSLKFDTPTSSLLASVNGPKLRTIQKEFRNKPLQQWSGKDVSDWLESLFMPEYKTNFSEAGITGSRLATLDCEDLSELGVNRVGHRLNMKRSLKRYLLKSSEC